MFVGEAITELLTRNKNIEGNTYCHVDEHHNVNFDAYGSDYTFVPDAVRYTFKVHALKNLSAYDRNELLVFVNKQCSRPSCKAVLDDDCIDIVFEHDFSPIYGVTESMHIENVILSESGRESFPGFVTSAIALLAGFKELIIEDFEQNFGKI